MNEQDGNVDVGAPVDVDRVRSTLSLFIASAIRGVVIAGVNKLSPALVDDPSVKVTVEVVATLGAIGVMALLSTRSTLKKVSAAVTSNVDAVTLDRVLPAPPALTGSRVGPKE